MRSKTLLQAAVFLLIGFAGSGQNVGIGTTTPLMKLHVVKGDSAVALLENTQTLAANISDALYFKTGSGSYPYTGAMKTIGQGSIEARMGFYTYASSTANGLIERMNITDAGNVGIGTTNPLNKLHVDGNFGLYSGLFNYGSFTTNNTDLMINANRTGLIGTPSNLILQLTTGSGINQLTAGNVGIGVDTPLLKLHILGDLMIENNSNPYVQFREANVNRAFIQTYLGNCRISINNANNPNGKIILTSNGIDRFFLDNNGNISIGNTYKVATGYKVSVQGKVMCEELKVQLNANWPDYVFDRSYPLKSIDELENYVNCNKHLPGLLPATAMEKNGVELGDMQRRLTEKVEELSLYIIQLQKQINELKQSINPQKVNQ